MSDARDVGRHLNPIDQAHTRHFTQSRVWLLGRLCVNARTDTTLLWAGLERWATRLVSDLFSSLANELIDRWHADLQKLSQNASSRQEATRHPKTSNVRIRERLGNFSSDETPILRTADKPCQALIHQNHGALN